MEKENKDYTKMNIFQKMLIATSKIERVKKNLTVGTGNNTYKAVSEKDVLDAVKDIEVELGIYSYPFERTIVDTNVLTTTSEYNGKTTEKNQLFMRNETIYRFVNVDNPTEFIDIKTWGDGVDSQDKAPGKAMTYADKYALLKAYKIETGDDPDKDKSEDLKKVSNSQKQETPKKVSKATEKQIELIKELFNEEEIAKALDLVKKDKIEDLTVVEASNLISKRKKVEE